MFVPSLTCTVLSVQLAQNFAVMSATNRFFYAFPKPRMLCFSYVGTHSIHLSLILGTAKFKQRDCSFV